MPIFEYVCRDCDHHFEAIVMGSKTAKCPKCHSRKLQQQVSRFAVAGKGSSDSFSADSLGSDSGGACGACGNPDGPGACGIDDID